MKQIANLSWPTNAGHPGDAAITVKSTSAPTGWPALRRAMTVVLAFSNRAGILELRLFAVFGNMRVPPQFGGDALAQRFGRLGLAMGNEHRAGRTAELAEPRHDLAGVDGPRAFPCCAPGPSPAPGRRRS